MDPVMAEDGKRILHAHLLINGGHLMLNDEFPEYGSAAKRNRAGVTLHLQVTDADAAWSRAIAAGSDRDDAARRPVLGRPLRAGRQTRSASRWSIGAPVKQAQQAQPATETAA